MSEIAVILGPDGTPATKPGTVITLEEAELLTEYSNWAKREMLSAELGCYHCGKKMDVNREGVGDIGIICDCRMLFWKAS
jgi:hypothetical protein